MTQLFFILLISGLMLIGAEVFIPGGILGAIGGIALLGASITAFSIFPPLAAAYITGGIILMVGVIIALWIKLFPKTWVGKQMTVTQDLHDAKGTEDHLLELLGAKGISASQLHPAGYAEINGRRIDVITQGEMIDKDVEVHVIEVEGNRVVVAQVEA
jgi:membrane-bound serine protease (ClpP class)